MTVKKNIIYTAILFFVLVSCQHSPKDLKPTYWNNMASTYVLQARESYLLGDTLAAIGLLDRAIELDSLQPDWFLSRGGMLEQIGDSARGFKDFLKSIEIDSTYEEGYYNIGITLREQGRFAESIYYGEKLVSLDSSGWTSYGLAVSYYYVGEFEKALSHLKKYEAVNKDRMWPNYYFGVTYKSLGDTLLAKQYLNRSSEQGNQMAKDELEKLIITSK